MEQLSPREYNKQWRENHKDRLREYRKKYRETHREQRRAYMREYCAKNPQKIYGYTKNYRKKHPDKRTPEKRIERAKHPDRQVAHYTVQFSGNIHHWYCCMNCGAESKLEEHHPDYSKPLETFTLCQKCHKAVHRELRKKDVKK